MEHKRSSIRVAAVSLAAVLLTGCVAKDAQEYISQEPVDYNIGTTAYCAKEKTEENRIYFNYPLLEDTVANADGINKLVLEFVETAVQTLCKGEFDGDFMVSPETWKWDDDAYTLQAMDIGYKIVRSDDEYFTVTFEGLYNFREAAHPIHYFDAITIDVKACKVVLLDNLFRIDSNFIELLRAKFKEQIRPGLAERAGTSVEDVSEYVEECFPELSDEVMINALLERNPGSRFGFSAFMTDTAIGISVPLSFALGSHFEVMISYDELKPIEN